MPGWAVPLALILPSPLQAGPWVGVVAGLLATAVMTLTEAPARRRWGLVGTLEWHENQVMASRLLRRRPDGLLAAGLALHFLHGGLAGAVFVLGLGFLGLNSLAPVLGPPFGAVLWLVTLAIHRPITGVRPWNHPLGRGPALLSLAGHLVYGAVLGLLVGWP